MTRSPPPFERDGGFFRSVIDAKARLEMKHDPTIRAPSKSTTSCRSVRSPQGTDRVLFEPSDFPAIAHCFQESVFDLGRPRDVDYARNSGHSFCVVLWRIQNPGEPYACPQIILAQMQAWNINPNALKSGHRLTVRLSMGLAERQQRHDD